LETEVVALMLGRSPDCASAVVMAVVMREETHETSSRNLDYCVSVYVHEEIRRVLRFVTRSVDSHP
jgi:hypothetical protein